MIVNISLISQLGVRRVPAIHVINILACFHFSNLFLLPLLSTTVGLSFHAVTNLKHSDKYYSACIFFSLVPANLSFFVIHSSAHQFQASHEVWDFSKYLSHIRWLPLTKAKWEMDLHHHRKQQYCINEEEKHKQNFIWHFRVYSGYCFCCQNDPWII